MRSAACMRQRNFAPAATEPESRLAFTRMATFVEIPRSPQKACNSCDKAKTSIYQQIKCSSPIKCGQNQCGSVAAPAHQICISSDAQLTSWDKSYSGLVADKRPSSKKTQESQQHTHRFSIYL